MRHAKGDRVKFPSSAAWVAGEVREVRKARGTYLVRCDDGRLVEVREGLWVRKECE